MFNLEKTILAEIQNFCKQPVLATASAGLAQTNSAWCANSPCYASCTGNCSGGCTGRCTRSCQGERR